jgi:hypothetical protein
MLLRHQGYWTRVGFKVELTKAEKRRIKRHSSPRWEIDVVAYKARTNEVLAVECKSFLDSRGVIFRNGSFEPDRRYKLFTHTVLRRIVLARLVRQLEKCGACRPDPKVHLCLAVGKFASATDRPGIRKHFDRFKWQLFEPDWLYSRLLETAKCGYEDDVAFVVTKLLSRKLAERALAT